jgi:hypothetical protein
LGGLEAGSHELIVVYFAIAVGIDFLEDLFESGVVGGVMLLLEHSKELLDRQEAVPVCVDLLEQLA